MNTHSTNWKKLFSESIMSADKLAKCLPVDAEIVRQVVKYHPLRINPYYFSLIQKPYDPIWRQVVPDISELDSYGNIDPFSEQEQSPVPNLIHRYPDRVILLVSSQCAVYCRFCMRKRIFAKGECKYLPKSLLEAYSYLQEHEEIKEVILSGGDPFMLEDEAIFEILKTLRSIPHIEIIRIHTRIPCVLPQRITSDLVKMLKEFHPLYVNTHFNHPLEITPESSTACQMLADAGIPLGCQTVLLKNVNDDAKTMKCLMRKLLSIRVRPYYLHHPDPVCGTAHFRTSFETGLKIMSELRGYISGMAVPNYMIDLPGGKGKIPLVPEYVYEKGKDKWRFKNYKGEIIDLRFTS